MPEVLPTSIRLEPALRADLVQRAKAQGCSLTWLISWVLKDWNEREKKKK